MTVLKEHTNSHQNIKVFCSLIIFFYNLYLRVWVCIQASLCKNKIWRSQIWEDHQRQSSQVCWSIVCYWRNNGTSHWILYHQWSGDFILCIQDSCWLLQKNQKCKISINNQFKGPVCETKFWFSLRMTL